MTSIPIASEREAPLLMSLSALRATTGKTSMANMMIVTMMLTRTSTLAVAK